MEQGQITIDGISREYLIERRKTKTIKYKVYPDLNIKIIVPQSMTTNEIQIRLNKRRIWIRKSIEFFIQNKITPVSEYKSSTTIKYLGRQYRLKLIQSDVGSIKLIGKYLVVNVHDMEQKQIQDLIYKWYRIHAVHYFNRIITKCLAKLKKYGIEHPSSSIRKMKCRWGSCIQSKNKIIINADLIKESSQCIEYVIMHELCHLKYPNHNNQF